jgi:hypothetical protein
MVFGHLLEFLKLVSAVLADVFIGGHVDLSFVSAADLRVVVARPASMGLYVWLIFRIF